MTVNCRGGVVKSDRACRIGEELVRPLVVCRARCWMSYERELGPFIATILGYSGRLQPKETKVRLLLHEGGLVWIRGWRDEQMEGAPELFRWAHVASLK